MPLHLSHYDIIRSILSNSHVEKEIYIHDDADLISTSWAIKEFNRCYTSQKENKRLIQAGIPKVSLLRGSPKHTQFISELNLNALNLSALLLNLLR